MAPPKPLSLPSVTDIYTDSQKLASDYWILEGQFAGNAVFISCKLKGEDFTLLENQALTLINTLREKARSIPPGHIVPADHMSYQNLHEKFSRHKQTLTELRTRLEGPTWYNYEIDVVYQVVGNQPNPGQTGSAAPKRRKSSRTAAKHKTSDLSMTSSRSSSIPQDDAADGMLALASSSKGKHAKNSFAPVTPSPLGRTSGSLDKDQQIALLEATIIDANQKRREAGSSFNKAISHCETENADLENRINAMANNHTQQIADKDRIIAEKDAAITRNDFLIEKYKVCLLLYGVTVEENGDLMLSSIGKRGMEEDYEADRVRELKKHKKNLHAGIDKLQEVKDMLLHDIDAMKGKGKKAGQTEEVHGNLQGHDAGQQNGSFSHGYYIEGLMD